MRPLFFVKDNAGDVACEQALRLGKKSRGEGRERGKEAFSLFLLPSSPLN